MSRVSVTAEGTEVPANEAVRDSRATACAGTTRAGNPCRSRILVDGVYCMAHSKTLGADMAALGGKGGLASGETRREQAKSIRQRLAERLEENVDLVWAAFEDGLRSDDERVRIVAATSVLAEAFGKPAVTLVGEEERPVAFQIVSAFAAGNEIEAGDA